MEYFLPSEIGRLVLGYLKEEECKKTYNAFLSECVHLREYAVLLRRGREYPTSIGEKSLKQMLNEYGKQNAHEKQSRADSMDALWLKHDALITQLRSRCRPSQNLAPATAGQDYSQVQGARTRRSNRPTPSAVCLDNARTKKESSREETETQEEDAMEVSQPSSPEPIEPATESVVSERDSDCDDTLVVETGPESPMKNSQPRSTNKPPLTIRTLSPKTLGSLSIDINTGLETSKSPPLSPPRPTQCSEAKGVSTPSKIPVPTNTPKASTSKQGKTLKKTSGQENRFTNHQRNTPSSATSPPQSGCSSAVSASESDKVNNSPKKTHKSRASISKKPTKPVNKIDSPKPVRVTRRRTRQQIAKEETKKAEESEVTTIAEVHAAPSADVPEEEPLDIIPLTPRKSYISQIATNVGKSPRRKCPAPKRRSGCGEDASLSQAILPLVPAGGSAPATSEELNMPLLDDLINNMSFADKLAKSINRAKLVAESSRQAEPNPAPSVQEGESGLNTPPPRTASPEPKKKRRKVKKSLEPVASTSTEITEVTNDESVGNVLHLQDSAMTEEAMRTIIEMTRTEPEFDALFHMFNVDKDVFISEEYEKPYSSQTSSDPLPVDCSQPDPIPSTSTAELADDMVTPIKTAKVLYPAKDGTPEYVQTVEIAGIQELGMSTERNDGTVIEKEAVFKVPEPPRTDKSKEKAAEPMNVDKTTETASADPSNIPSTPPSSTTPAASTPKTTPIIDTPKSRSKKGGFYGRTKQKRLGIASKKKGAKHDYSSTDSDGSDRPSTPTLPMTALTYAQPTSQPVLPGVSAGIPQLVTPLTEAALGASGCSIVDLGHISGPATISVVTSDNTSTVVHSSPLPPSFNVIEELAVYTRGSTAVTQTGAVYARSQSRNKEVCDPQKDQSQIDYQEQIENQQGIQQQQLNRLQTDTQQEQTQQPDHQYQQHQDSNDQPQQQSLHQQQQQQQHPQQPPQPPPPPPRPVQTGQVSEGQIPVLAEPAKRDTQPEKTCDDAPSETTPRQSSPQTSVKMPPSPQHQCDDISVGLQSEQNLSVGSGGMTPSSNGRQCTPVYAQSPMIVVDSPHPDSGLSQSTKAHHAEKYTTPVSVGKAGSLIGSPFYSNPETPSLGGNEVVGSASPAPFTSPYSSMTASMQQAMVEETPKTSRSHHKRKDGCARTKYPWPEVKAVIAALKKHQADAAVTSALSDTPPTTESHIKENKTPEKVQQPPEGGGTPLATKEAEVAATMVAMASTPVKDDPYSHLPAGDPQAILTPQEQQNTQNDESQNNNNNNEETLRTPTKQGIPRTTFVSPERSPLLNKLIQASTDAMLNGRRENSETKGDTNGRPSGTKRPRSEEGKKHKQRSSKKIKLAKMDVDKFLAKVHDSS